jgi:hypothetical protein
MPYSRFCTLFAFLCAVVLPSLAGAARGTTDLAEITALTADAFVWGLGPEGVYRISKYNTIITDVPYNELKYGCVPAAWNDAATNAGDASVVYINAFVNFDLNSELVFTVPPSSNVPPPGNPYYVVAYYDAYSNSIGSIGTRTTPSNTPTSYLLVGPKSPYANKQTAKIHGHEYPVMASDTNLNWMLIRVLANTLIDASDSTSVPSVVNGVVIKFALDTLEDFEAHGPGYPSKCVGVPPPTPAQEQEAAPYQNRPTKAVDFFAQLGIAVADNPIPNRGTGLSGTALTDLPHWVTPQYGATTIYLVPSYGQKETLDSFAPLGLTKQGFSMPANWGDKEKAAFQAGYVLGEQILDGFITGASGGPDPYSDWAIVNDLVGNFPNNRLGYFYRSFFIVEGGVSNYPLDAIYPTLAGPFDGDQSYSLTFMPPIAGQTVATGIYPPLSAPNGIQSGFWSITVYQPDFSQAAAPFIPQTSVLNTSYSTADTAVLSVDATNNVMTVSAPNWGVLLSSTPILFSENALDYGLTPNTVYYVVCPDASQTPQTCPNADGTYTFQISTQWKQKLSTPEPPNLPVPIQNSGSAPPQFIVSLKSPSNAGSLTYGPVKPVTQLGSSQLDANQLTMNADGSLTLWFGPTLPPDAPVSNWIPTPNSAYYDPIYGPGVSTAFQVTLRMYYPMPGDNPPSILPCTTACNPPMHETYIPPPLVPLD